MNAGRADGDRNRCALTQQLAGAVGGSSSGGGSGANVAGRSGRLQTGRRTRRRRRLVRRWRQQTVKRLRDAQIVGRRACARRRRAADAIRDVAAHETGRRTARCLARQRLKVHLLLLRHERRRAHRRHRRQRVHVVDRLMAELDVRRRRR